MALSEVSSRGLVLLGCGKMGLALLRGWLVQGVDAAAVQVVDPNPAPWLDEQGVRVSKTAQDMVQNPSLDGAPAVVLLAVKPQVMAQALPPMCEWGAEQGVGKTVFLSVAAGTPIAFFESILGAQTPIVRAMPNTPAAIGRGMTALIGNAHVSEAQLTLAETLMGAVGQTVRLDDEAQIDAVTGVSGSGPAYIFHLIEALAHAGVAQGLPEELSMRLAKATVAGAGALAAQSDENPAQLRVNVTSPGGTTEAALEVLMDEAAGLMPLMDKAVAAATRRGRELRG